MAKMGLTLFFLWLFIWIDKRRKKRKATEKSENWNGIFFFGTDQGLSQRDSFDKSDPSLEEYVPTEWYIDD